MNTARIWLLGLIILLSCEDKIDRNASSKEQFVLSIDSVIEHPVKQSDNNIFVESADVYINQIVRIKDYFSWMDSVVKRHDSLVPYNLTEHILVHANKWLIDTLAHTDYYWQMRHGNFVYDQKQMVVLREGDTLRVPTPDKAEEIILKLNSLVIDVNIPEYKLRILHGSDTLYSFPVRVGRNAKEYLETARRVVDLKTVLGNGKIVEIYKNPIFINPCSGRRYIQTRRDDDRITLMPQIPWLEPEIEGIRQGHLIHPTTNPETLGKPYSHGCIGTRESDAWIIYYHSPLYTTVVYRYDLEVIDGLGDTLYLEDIYGFNY